MHYDCASPMEMRLVLATGADPSRIIYANPIKQPTHISFARSENIRLTTFDTISELFKIKNLAPRMSLILRIKPDDSHSKVPLGSKFGAEVGDQTYGLLMQAKLLNLTVVGVSFHVGSNCISPLPYVDAIGKSKKVFEQARRFGFQMDVLDIGGGFPGPENDLEFSQIAKKVSQALEFYFPDGVQFIAEPGRFFSSPLMTSVASISSRRSTGDAMEYFITQSAFGVFSEGLLPQKKDFHPKVFKKNHSDKEEMYPSKLWGPTCASQDVINTPATLLLPELEEGDWTYFENTGAYSLAFGFSFIGLGPTKRYFTNSRPDLLLTTGVTEILKKKLQM